MPSALARRIALVSLILGSSLGLCGCSLPNVLSLLGGVVQGATGQNAPALGNAPGAPGNSGNAGGLPGSLGQLNGPITAGFQPGTTLAQGNPQAPSTSDGSGGGEASSAPSGSLGDRIKQAAESLPVPFPYAPGTEGGNLGCADVVTTALVNAGALDPSEHSLSVDGAESNLSNHGWQSVSPPPYKDGDVIVWSPTASGHKHIGIICVENGQVYAVNNSSSQRRPVKVLLSDYDRGVDNVLRSPDMMS